MRIVDIEALIKSIAYTPLINQELKKLKDLGIKTKQLDTCKRALVYFPKTYWPTLTYAFQVLLKDAPRVKPEHIQVFANCVHDLKEMKIANPDAIISLAASHARRINENQTSSEIEQNWYLDFNH